MKKYSSKKKLYNRRMFVCSDGFIICHICLNNRKKNKLLRKWTKYYVKGEI